MGGKKWDKELCRKLLGRTSKFCRGKKKKRRIFNLFSKFVFCIAKLNDIHFISQLLNSEMAPRGISFFFFFEKIINLDWKTSTKAQISGERFHVCGLENGKEVMTPRLIYKFNADLAVILIGSLFYLFDIELGNLILRQKGLKIARVLLKKENGLLVREAQDLSLEMSGLCKGGVVGIVWCWIRPDKLAGDQSPQTLQYIQKPTDCWVKNEFSVEIKKKWTPMSHFLQKPRPSKRKTNVKKQIHKTCAQQ